MKDLGCTVLPCVHEYVKDEAAKRKKKTVEARSKKGRFKRNVCEFNKRADNSMRKHIASIQRMFRFNGISAEHTGSKKNKKVQDLGIGPESTKKVFDYSNWNLVLMDLNGTLLWRKWIGHKEGYAPCNMRPYVKEFVSGISMETRTLIGMMCSMLYVLKTTHRQS